MKILGLPLSIEPQFSLAEYTFPIKGPVYLDEITVIQEYKRESANGYISAQRADKEPKKEKRDILRELEDYGLKITTK